MNSPGAIGAGPATRPFFNRAAAGRAPLAPYSWGALGTSNDYNAGGVSDITVSGIECFAGETVLVALVLGNNSVDVDAITPLIAGNAPNNGITSWVYQGGAKTLFQWWYYSAGGLSGDVVVDFTGSTALPVIVAMLVSRVSSVNPPLAADKTKGAFGTSTNQDSGLTPATAQAREFLWGTIGTNGFGSDSLGTWQGSFTAGQRASDVNGIDLKEGYRFVNAISTYRSQVTGASNRAFRSLITTFKQT